MVTRKTRSREAPKRSRDWVRIRGVWKKIAYVDGYVLRDPLMTDLDIMMWLGDRSLVGTDFTKPNEIWIDGAFAAETSFLLKVYRIETMKRWWRKGENGRYPGYMKDLRPYLKKKLCKPGPVPPFIERSEWNAEHQLTIQYVRGEIVRQYHDPHFTFGGHDLIYPYIETPRTVWIDVRQDPREIPDSFLHEIRERRKMEKGATYDEAHEYATRVERMARARRHIMLPARKDERLMNQKLPPLAVEPTAQEGDATCGPRALKMILDFHKRTYRGKPYTEKKLVELCECGDEGTEHANLITGALAVGANVFVKEHGTLDELRHFILKERLPVLIGWWNGPERKIVDVQADPDTDEGHFSVAMHLTRQQIWLADPWIIDPKDEDKGAAGIRREPLRRFMRQSNVTRPPFSWCDTDTPKYLPTNRWYMVLNFEGKTWRFPGGMNYKP